MSSVPVTTMPPRKSFAQVAAAANVHLMSNEQPTNKSSQHANTQSSTKRPSISRQEHNTKVPVNGSTAVSLAMPIGPEINQKDQLAVLLQAVHLHESHSHVPTTDHQLKKESDTKSVASRTTLMLDEKESLRPDDSASMQAAVEEDAFSPSGSVVAGSREGSDPDARAFRDQLHVIDRTCATGVVSQEATGLATDPSADLRNGAIIYATPPTAPCAFNLSESTTTERLRGSSAGLVIPPDEKLLEALASPKDRLFVLKVEQDMIDFIRDSKEEFLQLPQTNSFYRMLSHKLADYYLLGHLIDESMTSVRIHRTPHSHLPPPLMGSNSSADGSTPPPSAPARKIMRRAVEGLRGQPHRGAGVGNFDSPNSSKPTSDTGAASGGDESYGASNNKDKATLTREERESRYNEARARIFKDFKEDVTEGVDGAVALNERETSRSSSASGIKKGKKHKKPKDDGFEARSVYSQYGNQPFSATGFGPAPNGSFYNPFASYAVAGDIIPPNRSFDVERQAAPPAYSSYHQQASPAIGTWPGQLSAQGFAMQHSPNTSSYRGREHYENTNVFAGSVHSFPSPNTASQATPKQAAPPLATYSSDFLSQAEHNPWHQSSFNSSYTVPPMVYNANNNYPDPAFWSQQMMYPSSPGPYGSFHGEDLRVYEGSPAPDTQYDALRFPYHGFARQQFNPRSQTFVPAMRGGPVQAQHSPAVPYGATVARYPNSAPLQRQMSNTSQGSGYSSPYIPQPIPNATRLNGHTPLKAQAQTARHHPQSFASSISKWGNPSTLPPKPPPPAISSPYFEVPKDPQNQQPLPPNPFANMLRPASSNHVKVQSSR